MQTQQTNDLTSSPHTTCRKAHAQHRLFDERIDVAAPSGNQGRAMRTFDRLTPKWHGDPILGFLKPAANGLVPRALR